MCDALLYIQALMRDYRKCAELLQQCVTHEGILSEL